MVITIRRPSSNISSMTYNTRSHRLIVRFLNAKFARVEGCHYAYSDVPLTTWTQLVATVVREQSLGQAFHRLVKVPGYDYRRISWDRPRDSRGRFCKASAA